jgi:hypothetical protein
VWLERLTANAVVATVLGSMPASSDTVESEGRQMKQCLNIVHNKKITKKLAKEYSSEGVHTVMYQKKQQKFVMYDD